MTTGLTATTVTCELLHDQTVNYAVQQNHVPIIKRLRVTNTSTTPLTRCQVTVTSAPAFALPFTTTVDLLPPGEAVDLKSIDLQLSGEFLAGLTERLAGTLTVTVTHGSETLAITHSPIDMLAFDEWNGTQTLPEIIAAFVTPNHPEVARLVRQVAAQLQTWRNDPSLCGYQRKDPKDVHQQLAAIYAVLQAQDIAYCVPPASFEEQGQKIRTPDVIREQQLGTCLDLAVLYAACAEAVGLHPLIIFTESHAFAGVWLVEESFAESIQDDVTLLTKRMAPGVGEICLIEATALCAGNGSTFEEAVAAGEANLHPSETFHFFVDIRRARASRIRPLPLRVHGQVVTSEAETPTVSLPVSTYASAMLPEPPTPLSTTASPYAVFTLPRVSRSQDEFYLPTTNGILASQIAEVINAEGPISFNLLSRRLIQAWGMSQVGTDTCYWLTEYDNLQPVAFSLADGRRIPLAEAGPAPDDGEDENVSLRTACNLVLAQCYAATGKSDLAEPLFEATINITEDEESSSRPDIYAADLTPCAAFLHSQHRATEADALDVKIAHARARWESNFDH